MVTTKTILNTIGQPNNKANIVVRMHSTGDIISQMQNAHYDNSQYAQKIAHHFKSGSVKQTCKKIFHWIKNNIEYRIEPATLQTTKSIQRLISDGYGDCKHYSGFFAAILSALGIKHKYRFVAYNGGKIPTHVYVVAFDERGKEIICDAVLPDFNTEKPYSYKIDKIMLMHLSGIGAKGKAKAALKKVVQAPKKAVQAVVKKVTPAAQKVAKAVKKIPAGAAKLPLAPARGAFLTLISFNVRGWANKLKANNQTLLKKKWNSLGGDFVQLQKAINTGSGKKAFLAGDQYIGEPTTIAAALASAVPIIVAVKEFLKENPEFIDNTKKVFEKNTGQKVEETPFESQPDVGINPADPEGSKDGMGGNKILLIGAAGLAAVYLLSKKK